MLGVQITTTVPSFHTVLGIKAQSPWSHFTHYMAIHPSPSFLKSQPEKKARVDVKTLRESLSVAPLDEKSSPILHLELSPFLCFVVFIAITLGHWKRSRSSFLKIKHFTSQSFSYQDTTLHSCLRNQDGIIDCSVCLACLLPLKKAVRMIIKA